MPYLVDRHNLIPKLGLRLDSMDDELELVAVLQEFCRLERKKQVEVYFDGAPPLHAGTRKLGHVTAHFVPRGTTADEAIRKRLKKIGKSAKNWIVVSSDRQVQADARGTGTSVISSDEFAQTLRKARNSASKPAEDRKLSDKEVDEWMNIFHEKKSDLKGKGNI